MGRIKPVNLHKAKKIGWPAFILLLQVLNLVVMVQSSCPNWCSGNGVCTSEGIDGFCMCHEGWTSEDCRIQMCKKNFDPVFIEEQTERRTIRLITHASEGTLQGRYEFSFGQSSVFFEAVAPQFDSAACTQALTKLKSVRAARCVREDFVEGPNSGSYLIRLESFPEAPFENNIFSHDGNPPLSAFGCNTTRIDEELAMGISCTLADVIGGEEDTETPALPLYSECSNRGVCGKQGQCTCNRGFYGDSCFSTSCTSRVSTRDPFVRFARAPPSRPRLFRWPPRRT